jgi:two-component system, chemotaxis family, chemotaxis protein CheY
MEILFHQNYKEFLEYLPNIKSSLKEWLFTDVRLTVNCDKDFTVTQAADLLYGLFKNKEGKLYICNDREIIIMLRWGKGYALSEVTRNIERHLPEGSCEVHVHEPTPEGLGKLELLITYKKPAVAPSMADIRGMRRENIVVVADDDMYIRFLVKEGMSAHATVYEVSDGSEIIAAYKKYVPDILLLDIHMPNMDGTKVLQDILAIDPPAHIVMLSGDSSLENVKYTTQHGAKGFMTKPFKKDKLLEYFRKCPTTS